MARAAGWRVWTLVGAVVVGGSCEGDITRPGVESLSIQADRYLVPEGETEPLWIVAKDVNGASVPASEVRWSSSDASVAVVGDHAMLNAREPGVVAITARVRESSVTRTFRVGFRDVERGSIGMRVSGSSGMRHTSLSRATLLEPVDGSRDVKRTEIFAFPRTPDRPLNPDESYGIFATHFPADTVLWLAFFGAPAEGNLHLETLLPQIRADGTAVPYEGNHAVLRVRDARDPNRQTVFMPVQYIDVTVDDIRLPEPGRIDGTGTVRGSISYEAAGLILEDQGGGNPRVVGQTSGQTTMVYAEFEAPLDSWLLGRAAYEIDGLEQGSIAVTAEEARATAQGDQVVSHHWGAVWTGPSTVLNVTPLLRIALGAPEIAVGPARHPDGSVPCFEGTTLEMRISRGDNGTITTVGTLVATGGSVTVDAYQAPGTHTFGVVRGSVQATGGLEGGSDAGASAPVDIAGSFELALAPLCATRAPCP